MADRGKQKTQDAQKEIEVLQSGIDDGLAGLKAFYNACWNGAKEQGVVATYQEADGALDILYEISGAITRESQQRTPLPQEDEPWVYKEGELRRAIKSVDTLYSDAYSEANKPLSSYLTGGLKAFDQAVTLLGSQGINFGVGELRLASLYLALSSEKRA